MAQIFSEKANRLAFYGAVGAPLSLVLVVGGFWYYGSPKYTDVGYMPRQPIPYSHRLHVGQLGLDCRYCHASVEVSPVANIPPSQVCMNCHKLIQRESPKLEPLRESLGTGMPIPWIRVHNLPDYAYFDHRPHLRAGVGCVECHGRVDQMEEVVQVEPLSMSWCLDCHRNPAPHLRPPEEITNLRWIPPEDQPEIAQRLIEELALHPPTDCTGCHR